MLFVFSKPDGNQGCHDGHGMVVILVEQGGWESIEAHDVIRLRHGGLMWG